MSECLGEASEQSEQGLMPTTLPPVPISPPQWTSLTCRHRVGAGLDGDGRGFCGTVHYVTCKAGLGAQGTKKNLPFPTPPPGQLAPWGLGG